MPGSCAAEPILRLPAEKTVGPIDVDIPVSPGAGNPPENSGEAIDGAVPAEYASGPIDAATPGSPGPALGSGYCTWAYGLESAMRGVAAAGCGGSAKS
mmetsp:Transcript_89708/g.155257  ORF Transcript_89708/g.155257 Transcript_89708/m.155257 type:complete len:98 (-) Transcript_89708:1250-1543(-)